MICTNCVCCYFLLKKNNINIYSAYGYQVVLKELYSTKDQDNQNQDDR